MTNDSIHAPIGAKTIFNCSEPTLREEFSSLSREALEVIACAMAVKLLCINEDAVELLTSDPSPEKVREIAKGMFETLESSDEEHEAWYGGDAREALLKVFPALRRKGAAA